MDKGVGGVLKTGQFHGRHMCIIPKTVPLNMTAVRMNSYAGITCYKTIIKILYVCGQCEENFYIKIPIEHSRHGIPLNVEIL